jgi:F0F1-type ATP synthase assembly protein I
MKKKNSMAMGILLGTFIGIITDNLGLWLPLGIVFGAAAMKKGSKNEQESPSE